MGIGNLYIIFGGLLTKFLGDGIFNVDGPKWSDARALLRPQFLKQRVSDLQVFEEHIGEMISLLPTDGQTINLMEWWYRFTLDASTHYLFGESVGSLTDSKVF
jgi:cytochrome P450